MNIYVGNLSRDLNGGELREAFAAFGSPWILDGIGLDGS
jgi:RNA recognition motif-containing protein